MTREEYAEVLVDVTANVLEEAAFVFTEPAEGGQTWEGEVVEVQLAFSGDGTGRLMMTAPKSLGLELAANLLGMEPGEETDIERPAEAAFSEILNMIAGPLAVAWFGEEAVCRIGVPEAKTIAGSTHRSWSEGYTCSASLVTEEEDPIELAAVIE
jgi:CheY-specific phosphatase CheX